MSEFSCVFCSKYRNRIVIHAVGLAASRSKSAFRLEQTMIRTPGGDTRRGRVSQPHGVPKTLVCICAKVIQSPTPLDVKIVHVRGRAEVMLCGMLDEQEKTLSSGSSAYLLATVCAGASRQCCDATQKGRISHLEDLESWTRHAWFRRGVIEETGRYVEGRDGARGTRDP